MGRKTSTETLAKLFVAFLENPTWTQKNLERRCEVSARAIRKCLLDMQAAGVALEREEEHPHVYWSVDRTWLHSVAARQDLDTKLIARLIARLPRSETRDRILEDLLGALRNPNSEMADADEEAVSILEDSARNKVAIRSGYYSASRGEHGLRTLSVQRVVYSEHLRFVARCHTTNALKWFRADRLTSPRLEANVPYISVDAAEVNRLIAESMDGFHGGAESVECDVFVRAPESRWVVRNLPRTSGEVVATHEPNGVRLTTRTTALDVLARFIVGLGGSAVVTAPRSLRARVRTLARESLLANTPPKLNGGPVRANRSTRPNRIAPSDGQ